MHFLVLFYKRAIDAIVAFVSTAFSGYMFHWFLYLLINLKETFLLSDDNIIRRNNIILNYLSFG